MNPDHSASEELEHLAADSGWVEGLARRLVRDSHAAEDLVQDAWLEALTRGSDASVNLSAWMAGVVRKLALGQGRKTARRKQREQRAARPEAQGSPSVEESAEKLEQQALLIQTVLALREPYRGAVLMRFIEEQQPREIAERLNLPVATVNSRLTRGLDLLREELVRAHGGDRERWLGAMLPLCGWPSRDGVVLFGLTLMNSKLLLVAGLLLAVLGAFFLRGEGAEPTDLPALEGSALSIDLRAGEQPLLERSPTRIERVVSEDSHPQREELASLEAQDGLLVRLLLGNSDEPAAHAEFFLNSFEQPQLDPAQRLEMITLQVFDPMQRLSYLRQNARRFTSDERGEVRIPSPPSAFECLATLGELTGYDTPFDEVGDELVVRLWPRAEVEVSVRDEAGNALTGVQVAVRYSSDSFAYVVDRRSTDGEGRVTLRIWLVEDERMPRDYLDALDVVLDTPLAVLPATPLVLRREGKTKVELVCPATGSLEVELARESGEPFADGSLVLLETHDEQVQRFRFMTPGTLLGRVSNGVVRFEHIGLDLELDLIVPLSWIQDNWRTTLAGPKQPLEVARHSVVVDAGSYRYGGQLVDAAGELVREQVFVLAYDSGNGSAHQWTERSDEQGRFQVELIGMEGRPPSGELRFKPQREPESRFEVVRELTAFEGPGPHDLGAIAFGPEPLPMCSGVLLDPHGRPVEGAWLGLGTREGEQWQQLELQPARSDSEGRFTFFGDFPQEELWLQVNSQRRWRHEPERVYGPSNNLEIWLLGSAQVSGRILTDEDISAGDLAVGVWDLSQREAPSRLAIGWRDFGVSSDGSFTIKGLPEGRYDVVVDLAHNGNVLASFDSVELREDGLTDSRLELIDLRGALRTIDVSVANADGHQVIADVWFVPDGERAYSLGRGPQLLLPFEAEGSLMGLVGPGLPAIERLSSKARYQLRSPKGLQLELAWPAEPRSTRAALRFSVELEPLDLDHGVDELRRARRIRFNFAPRLADLSPGGTAKLTLPAPGRYQVSWSAYPLEPSADARASHWKAEAERGGVVIVSAGQARLELQPDADWLAGLAK